MPKKKYNKKSTSPKNHPKKTDLSISESNHSPRTFVSKYSGPILIILTAIIMAWWSWGKWTDPMVDFGRELYVPWQILEGKTLYTDIAYFNGPFSPYFNALWFWILGVHMGSLMIANFIILSIIILLFYKLLVKMDGRIGATVGCLILVMIFAFPRYDFVGNYNFIAPYSHEMIHGLFLSFSCFYLLSIYQKRKKFWLLFLAGSLLGMVFLTKVEYTLAATVAIVAGLILTFREHKESWKKASIKTAFFLLSALIPPIFSFILLSTDMPKAEAITGTLGSWSGTLMPELRNMYFYQHLLGVDSLGNNLKIMLGGFGVFLILFMPAILFSPANQNKKKMMIMGVILLTALILSSILFVEFLLPMVPLMLRPLPLLLGTLIVIELIRLLPQYHHASLGDIIILRLTVLAFSLILLLKILLKVDPCQYGFALAMPGTVFLASALVTWIPSYLKDVGKPGILFSLYSIFLIIFFISIHLLVSEYWFSKTTVKIKTETASFYADLRGHVINDMINEIKTQTSSRDTLAVLPEGVMLNFLTRRVNPTPYINFMPPEFILFGESKMLSAFKRNPPDYIVLTNKPLEEYGMGEVGVDIGAQLYQWIEENYTLIKYIKPDYESRFPFTHMRLLRYTRHS